MYRIELTYYGNGCWVVFNKDTHKAVTVTCLENSFYTNYQVTDGEKRYPEDKTTFYGGLDSAIEKAAELVAE